MGGPVVMMEKYALGLGVKLDEESGTMVGRDVMNNRIVVSLWTIQVVTVLFVIVSTSIWMALMTGVPLGGPVLIALGIVFVSVLVFALFAECRFYLRHILSVQVYVRLQVAKAISWALVLLVLLKASSGMNDAGIRVFTEAAKKLILPFLASVLYSLIIYRQERGMRASNGPEPVGGLFLAAEHLEPSSPG